MPGAGKSAVGRVLAERLGWRFIDIDFLIFETKGITHHEYMLKNGEQALMDLEQQLTLNASMSKTVFSPPGSIVFSPKAMEKIKKETTVIYIKVSLDEVKKHLGERLNQNGIIGLEEKGIEGVFFERTPIYEKFADYIIDGESMEKQEKIEKIYKLVNEILQHQS